MSIDIYSHYLYNDYFSTKNGDIYSLKSNKFLSKKKNNGNGYLTFCLYSLKLEKSKTYYQHRFVYEVFNGLIPKEMEVDHRNGIKSDNRIENLQLLTHKKNIEKSFNKPIIATCINTNEEKKFKSIKEASKELNISSSTISSICKNKIKSSKSKNDMKKYTFRYIN